MSGHCHVTVTRHSVTFSGSFPEAERPEIVTLDLPPGAVVSPATVDLAGVGSAREQLEFGVAIHEISKGSGLPTPCGLIRLRSRESLERLIEGLQIVSSQMDPGS